MRGWPRKNQMDWSELTSVKRNGATQFCTAVPLHEPINFPSNQTKPLTDSSLWTMHSRHSSDRWRQASFFCWDCHSLPKVQRHLLTCGGSTDYPRWCGSFISAHNFSVAALLAKFSTADWKRKTLWTNHHKRLAKMIRICNKTFIGERQRGRVVWSQSSVFVRVCSRIRLYRFQNGFYDRVSERNYLRQNCPHVREKSGPRSGRYDTVLGEN